VMTHTKSPTTAKFLLIQTLNHLHAARENMPDSMHVREANNALDEFDDHLDACIDKAERAVALMSVAEG
jgi:hypothetical protein